MYVYKRAYVCVGEGETSGGCDTGQETGCHGEGTQGFAEQETVDTCIVSYSVRNYIIISVTSHFIIIV